MEKLIELLNEYKKIKWYDWNTKITNYNTDTGSFTNCYHWLEYETVIGKRYGFIKRLVDYDKIDRDKIIEKSDFMPIVSNKVWDFLQPTEEQELLMLLSIQDNPIEFLISVLK